MKTTTLQECKSQVMKPYKMESGKIAALVVAGILALGATPLLAASIVPDDYAKSFSITFPGYSGSETLTDFPVLVKVSQARNDFDYSACQVANGGDLRFADASGNLLSSEVDTWNTSGESLVWVKVPSLNKDTVIIAYYGNANPPAVTASDVWSNGYVGVWHLNESAAPLAESSGISTPFKVPQNVSDRTTYAANGVAGSKSVSFYNDQYTAGMNRRLEADDDPDLRGLMAFTVELWVYQMAYRNDGKEATVLGNQGNWKIYQRENGELGSRWRKGESDNVWGPRTSSAPALNEWTYQTFVRDVNSDMTKADCKWYCDGSLSSSSTENNPQITGNGSVVTNALGSGDVMQVFPGSIDEVRVSNVARSADWVKATHDCVMDEGFAFYATTGGNDWAEYSHKFRVSFSGYAGSETLTDFPVLVKISESSITGFRYVDCKKPGGGDLRFSDSAGNLLASEVDTWNTNGVSLVWVKVPALTASTRITAYYGWNMSPAVDSKSVWANGYVGVWHLNESAAPMAESSGVSTPFSAGTKPNLANCGASGIVGKSVDFDNNGSYGTSYGDTRLEAADDDNLEGFTSFTVECWTYQTSYWGDISVGIGVLAKRTSASDNRSWWISQKNKAADPMLACSWSCDGVNSTTKYSETLAASGEWSHQVFVRDVNDNKTSAALRWYFDGAGSGSWTESDPQSITNGAAPLILGGGNGMRIFPGSIDEARISNVARSADWVKATHDTVTESSFATYGEAKENVKTGMFIIFR